jgi:hypothetical protein
MALKMLIMLQSITFLHYITYMRNYKIPWKQHTVNINVGIELWCVYNKLGYGESRGYGNI